MTNLVNPYIYGSAAVPRAPDLNLNFISSTLLGNFSYTRASAGLYVNSSAKLVSAGLNTPRFEYNGSACLGIKAEGFSQNFCTNYNANPTNTTGLTAGGDGAAVLSVIADPSNLLTTAIYDYGNTIDLTSVCTAGNVVKLDNTAGTTNAWVELSGNPPDTTGLYSLSVFAAAINSPGFISYGASALATAPIPLSSVLTRAKLFSITPDVTTRNMRLTIPAGGVLYFILWQFEENPFPSSVVVVAGASASRGMDNLFDSSIASRSYYNANAGCIIGEFDLDEISQTGANNQEFINLANGTGATNAMNVYMNAARPKIRTATAQNSVKPTLTIGTNAGQSATDIGSVDVINDVYQTGFSWNIATGSFIVISGGMTVQYHTFQGTFSAALNRLDIASRPFSQSMFGHIRSVKIWNTQPTVPQIGQQMNFANSIAISSEGQSSLATAWDADDNGLNGGELALLGELKKYYPTKRCYIIHSAMSGSTISNPSTTNGWWNSTTGQFQPLMYRALDMINAYVLGGGEVIAHYINGHEADTNQPAATLTTAFNLVEGMIWALPCKIGGTKIGNLPTIFQPIARRQDSNGNSSPYQHMREFQHAWIPTKSNVTLGTERINYPMDAGGVHVSNAGNAAYEPLDVRLLVKLLGKTVTVPTDCLQVASAVLSGNVVTITIAKPTDVLDFGPSTGIQGFAFFDQNTVPGPDGSVTGTRISATSVVRTDASTITMTLASVPSTTGLLYYAYGALYTDAGVYVDYTKLVAGTDPSGLPLRATTMLLPFFAPTTNVTWGDGTAVTWGDGTTTEWSA